MIIIMILEFNASGAAKSMVINIVCCILATVSEFASMARL